MAEKLTNEQIEQQVLRAVQEVEALCVPDLMPKEQALEFLSEVIGRLENSVEALEDEIAEASGDDNK